MYILNVTQKSRFDKFIYIIAIIWRWQSYTLVNVQTNYVSAVYLYDHVTGYI